MSKKQFAALVAVVLVIGSPFVTKEWVTVAQQIDRYETAKQQGLAVPFWGAVYQNAPR
jgi:hypothetical protein